MRSARSWRNGVNDVELQEVPDERILMVRVKQVGPSTGPTADAVAAVLNGKIPATTLPCRVRRRSALRSARPSSAPP